MALQYFYFLFWQVSLNTRAVVVKLFLSRWKALGIWSYNSAWVRSCIDDGLLPRYICSCDDTLKTLIGPAVFTHIRYLWGYFLSFCCICNSTLWCYIATLIFFSVFAPLSTLICYFLLVLQPLAKEVGLMHFVFSWISMVRFKCKRMVGEGEILKKISQKFRLDICFSIIDVIFWTLKEKKWESKCFDLLNMGLLCLTIMNKLKWKWFLFFPSKTDI